MRKFIVILLFCISFGQISAQNYTFNAKGTFKMSSSEGTFSSYFYLNTQNGNAGHDAQAFQMMTNENVEGYIFALIEYGKKMSQYMNVEGKKYLVEQPLSRENYTADMFWKEFKKTGKKQTFGKYTAQEYAGVSAGRKIALWLSEKTHNLEGNLKGDILGMYGLGYLYNPNEKVYYLIVHFQDEDAQVTLLDITPFSKSVTLDGYEKISTDAIPNLTGTETYQEDASPQEDPENGNQTQTYSLPDEMYYSTIFEQAAGSLEMGLPMLKQQVNNTQIPAEQRAELQKQVVCVEKSIPLYKQAAKEMKQAEQKYAGNTERLMEEFDRISTSIDEKRNSFCS